MKTFLNKLTSRKFLTCIAGIIMGICMAFGLDEGAVSTVSGAVTSIISVVMYIYTEGKIDKAAVKDAANKIKDAADAVVEIEEE